MKRGFYLKLAWSGIRKNRRLYTPYLLTCVGMVMMFYVVSFLSECPVLEEMRGGMTLQSMLSFGSWVIGAFALIFEGAFNPQAILGGAVGIGVREAMRYGVARGLFSNEAGMGSTPHAHAMAKVEKPQDQGVVAMVCVFIDTFVVLTITALVMITSGALNVGDMAANPAAENMAQVAFSTVFGSFGNFYVAICLLFFAFSTIIGWYFFGEQNVKYLFGVKAVKVYACIAVVCVALGAVLEAPLVWNLSDLFNALMVFPNLLALLALSGLVAKAARGGDALRK